MAEGMMNNPNAMGGQPPMEQPMQAGMADDAVLDMHLTEDVKQVLKTKYNIATVFRKKLPKKWLGRKVINGDKHDLRHLDPKKVVVGLIAKGKAKKDFNGFVQDV